MLQNLCTPALIYLIFSITQITIDIFKKDYNVALVKFTVAFVFTILLNYLCSSGLGIVSWIIVFIPFILMSVIVSYILTYFGIDPKTKQIRILQNGEELKHKEDKDPEEKTDETSPILSNVSVNYSEGDNKIIINYTSSEEGKIWCKAIKKSENKVPSVSEMKEEQSQSMILGDDNICNITNYLEDEEYDVYMYAEDKLENGMTNEELISTKKTIVTSSLSNNTEDSSQEQSNQPSTNGSSGVSGFQNITPGYSNFFHNNSRIYKERKQHINHINNILTNLNEEDNSSYFLIQAETCASKPTNVEYELCMKRLLQEIHARIKNSESKSQFLHTLKKTKINITGIDKKLI